MAILMLCDKPVYNIAKGEVLDSVFCPFAATLDVKKAYKCWQSNRVYLKTNRTAERVMKQAGGMDTREAKRRLSLSDGYWVKYGYDADTSFVSITPYLNPFSEARIFNSSSNSSSVPELVLGGSQPKLWGRGSDGITYLRKSETPEQIQAEMLAVKLARKCGIKTMNAFVQTQKGKVYADNYSSFQDTKNIGVINLVNMTNINRSMLQFDQLGAWVNGHDPISVAAGYAKAGVTADVIATALLQVVFDAIVGNLDRKDNMSNWAIFMDNETGVREPSWMYDFNWAALDGQNPELIYTVAANIKKAGAQITNIALEQALHIRDVCGELNLFDWRINSQLLLDSL